MSYTRFAVYFVSAPGALADFGAKWLGWDVHRGQPVDPFPVTGLDDVTMTPRKYGFHGTLKPPFRLREGTTFDELQTAVADLAQTVAPGRCDGLEPSLLGRFLALVPSGNPFEIGQVAAACVTELDQFRAPATEAELAKRRKAGLTERQESLLQEWGYPYVLDAFRFHMTLTGRLEKSALPDWLDSVKAHLPPLPQPFVLDAITLVGERPDGSFEVIQRYPLSA